MRPGQRIRREAAEHHRMHGADAGAGQHGEHRLGDHRHVDGHPVALDDAQLLQHVGEAADAIMKLAVGDLQIEVGLVAFPDDRDLIAALLQMTVNAVGGDVQRAVLEPFNRDVVRVVRRMLHFACRA